MTPTREARIQAYVQDLAAVCIVHGFNILAPRNAADLDLEFHAFGFKVDQDGGPTILNADQFAAAAAQLATCGPEKPFVLAKVPHNAHARIAATARVAELREASNV